MTWSYDPNEAANLDRVRGKIGDTLTTDQQLSNEVINAILVVKASVTLAAVECCRRLIAKYARDIDKSGANVTASRSQRVNQYRDLLEILEREAGVETQPFVGGLSIAEAEAIEADTDFKLPVFGIGDEDNT